MFKVMVFVDSVMVDSRAFKSEESALKFADEMQDSGFKVRFLEVNSEIKMSVNVKIFRKKPEFFEAQQFLNGTDIYSLLSWINTSSADNPKFNNKRYAEMVNKVLLIPTLDGYYIADPGDWVVRDAHGNFSVYDAVTFNELFEEA
jgi:hypothetical protein